MVGGEGWTCLEAKKVLGYEIGGMRVGGGRTVGDGWSRKGLESMTVGEERK